MAHCKNDQLEIIRLGLSITNFPKENPRELGC